MEEMSALLALLDDGTTGTGQMLDPYGIYKSLGMDPITKDIAMDGPSSQASGYGRRAARPFKEAISNARMAPGPMNRLRQTAGTVGGATDAALGLRIRSFTNKSSSPRCSGW